MLFFILVYIYIYIYIFSNIYNVYFYLPFIGILNITWSECVTNFEVRRRTGQPLLSDTVRIRRLKLFGHVARADKSHDHSRALQACISPAPRNWRRRPGRPRHTCLRTVEEDLRQFNLGLASGLRRAQNRTAWRTLTGTATSPKAPIDDDDSLVKKVVCV